MGCTENKMGAMLVPPVEGLRVEGLQVEGRSYQWRGTPQPTGSYNL